MTAVLLPNGKQQYFTTAGVPAVGYKVATYDAGTSNPRVTYQDALKVAQNTNPVILDGRGEASIFWEGVYKVQLQDSTGPVIWTQDNLSSQPNGFSGSILPAVTNSIDLGSITLSWRNVYVGPNNAPVLDTVSGNIGYIARTAAEIAAAVTPTNFWYAEGDLRRYGGIGDGATDDSVAFQRAVNVGIARIPKGFSFKIVTPATKVGQVTILGEGRASKLLCDSTVLTVTTGIGSVIDNFWMENITAPWIITRNPTNWALNITGTLQQSNTALGYQPTVNDTDIWATLTAGQQNQQVGPTITFTGIATDITVSRIYGRFVVVTIQDAQFSQFRDCDIRGGKGQWGGLVFDNATNNVQVGLGNSAVGNTVRFTSFSGITFLNNNRGTATGNQCQLNGESGIKSSSGPNATICVYPNITGNNCSDNYYDGIDAVTSFPTNITIPSYAQIIGNMLYRNGGDGVNIDGLYAICEGNYVVNNNRYGIWGAGAKMKISGNICFQNNVSAGPNHDILGGNGDGCIITDNYVVTTALGGASAIFYSFTGFAANNYAQGGSFFWGNVPTSFLDNNLDTLTGLLTQQSFVLSITNSAGTLQHSILSQSGALTLSGLGMFRINNAAAAATNTPTGADATTPMLGGGKIGSATTNNFYFDTNDQISTNYSSLMATIIYNDTATEARIRPQIASININGVTRFRLVYNFVLAVTGAAFALTTANIPAGKSIQVQFLGKLA